ncbi:MAG: HesA/MoeB/ThiF family protein [Bacillota bacterium]
MSLTELQKEIYARNIALSEVGEKGQEKLTKAAVLVVGNGGLGSSALLYLAAMGIGRIGLCDDDDISYSNLNRQVLYNRADVGLQKNDVAKKRLQELNPDIKIDLYKEFLTTENVVDICQGYDIVVDCLDNLATRILINDTCLRLRIPFVHAGIYKYHGQTLTVLPGKGPCLRCLFSEEDLESLQRQEDLNLSLDGVPGTTPGVFGLLEACEVFKYIVGLPVNNQSLFYLDTLNMTSHNIQLERNPHCLCNQIFKQQLI